MHHTTVERILFLFDRERYALAAAEIRRALGEDPHDAYAHALLALALAGADSLATAEEAARQAIAISPDQSLGFFALAQVQFQQRILDAAANTVLEAVRLDPESVCSWGLLAAIRLQQARWHEVLEASNAALALDPEHGESLRLKSLAQLMQRQRADASISIDRALAFVFGTMTIPVSRLRFCHQGWPRQLAVGYTVAMGILGLLAVMGTSPLIYLHPSLNGAAAFVWPYLPLAAGSLILFGWLPHQRTPGGPSS